MASLRPSKTGRMPLLSSTEISATPTRILNSTTAFFGAIVAGLLLADESLTPWKVIGALFGVLGVAAIMGIEAITDFDLRNLAQIAILAAARLGQPRLIDNVRLNLNPVTDWGMLASL